MNGTVPGHGFLWWQQGTLPHGFLNPDLALAKHRWWKPGEKLCSFIHRLGQKSSNRMICRDNPGSLLKK